MSKGSEVSIYGAGGASSISGQMSAIVDGLEQCNDSEVVGQYYAKVKAAREYAKIMNDVERSRVELLQVEIICIVKMRELGCKLKGVPSVMAEFFAKNGTDVAVYLRDYANCITARQIYNYYLKEEGLSNEKEKGRRTGYGSSKSFADMDDDEIRKSATASYFTSQEAMRAIVDDYASSGKSFTVEKMADRFIEETMPEEKESLGVEYVRGIREVCREAIAKSKIDTIGDKRAPRFVTYIDASENLKQNERWVRIPFGNARLEQLLHMVELRKEQLRQDTIAFNNLKEIYNELVELAGPDCSSLSIMQILEKSY